MLRLSANYIEFKNLGPFEDKAQIKGKDIFVDPTFEPQKNQRRYGYVTLIPDKLTRIPLPIQFTFGLPDYHTHQGTKFKYLSDIEPEVRIGDKIWFHFAICHPKNIIRTEEVDGITWYYYRVRYDQVICAVRDIDKSEVDERLWDKENPDAKFQVIIPIGGWALIQPIYEDWDDILIPTYSDVKGPDGAPMLRPKDKWIQTKRMPQAEQLLGHVVHVGNPLKGDVCEVMEGQKIVFHRNADWTNIIENVEYYAIRQSHIFGRWELETEEND